MGNRKGGEPGLMGNTWYHNKLKVQRTKNKLARKHKQQQRRKGKK